MNITEYTVKINSNRDLCAAFVADTHDIRYKKLVEEIRNRHVDLILITGDIIYGHDDKVNNGFNMLSEFVKFAPTFMSLGNHEGGAVKLVRKKCREIGVHLLESAFEEFEGIKIGGITSGYIVDDVGMPEGRWKATPKPDVKWLKHFASLDGYKLLLNHHPEYYPAYIRDLDIDLTLSGHAHGGQWRVFGRGVFAPGQGLFPKLTSGIHDDRLIVSRGLANNAFVPRLFNAPELIFINMKN